MRESDGIAKSVAADVLQSVSASSPRRVQWGTAASGIQAMLDGTSFQLPQLIAASPAPALGREMRFRSWGEAVKCCPPISRVRISMLSDTSHRLLVQLRGTDLGVAAGPWRDWIEGLY